MIRVPVHIHELMSKMTNIETTFRSKHGHAPSQEKLAGLVGISVEKLQMLLKVSPCSSWACFSAALRRRSSGVYM